MNLQHTNYPFSLPNVSQQPKYYQQYLQQTQQQMRRVLSQIFSLPKSVISKYFSEDFNLDPRTCPVDLLTELKSRKNLKKVIELVNKKQRSGLKLLKKLTVVHLCLINSASFCEPFRIINFQNLSESEWLNQNIIKPYSHFLKKICYSQELYKGITIDKIVDFTFDNLFFVIKLLKDLLECSKKITFLFHYYKKEAMQRSPFLLDSFVCLLAYHTQHIYAVFKAILSQYVRFPKKYIVNAQKQQILKYILEIELLKLNQDIAALFLNSSFFPFGKGYGIKLFKIDDLPDQTRDYAESIVYAERAKPKRAKKVTLDSLLFDRTGKLNPEIYQGLQQITLGEDGIQRYQSILHSRIGNAIKKKRDYQENIQNI